MFVDEFLERLSRYGWIHTKKDDRITVKCVPVDVAPGITIEFDIGETEVDFMFEDGTPICLSGVVIHIGNKRITLVDEEPYAISEDVISVGGHTGGYATFTKRGKEDKAVPCWLVD